MKLVKRTFTPKTAHTTHTKRATAEQEIMIAIYFFFITTPPYVMIIPQKHKSRNPFVSELWFLFG
jgi:hypothetical protein